MDSEYAAIRFQQADEGKWLMLFSAPAVEIEQWVGIPQKLKLGDDETAGFQRTISTTRLSSLEHFFRNPANTMQNPLLCAIRKVEGEQARFRLEIDEGHTQTGRLYITVPDFSELSLAELFQGVIDYLEQRVPELAQKPFPDELYQRLERQYLSLGNGDTELEEGDEEIESSIDSSLDDAVFEESQVGEFRDQLTARHRLATKLNLGSDVAELLGFTRDVLESYLKPVVLVDGQHRLEGALNAARLAVEEDQAAYKEGLRRIANGEIDADSLHQTLLREKSRKLPISLLMDASAAEHVFQFVVVNQKATPVPKALLSTIISTSLDTNELAQIKDRLEAADLKLESSQVISSLARSSASPFADKVARGFDEDNSTMLPWSVLVTLADLFRNLRGAKYYHDTALDHAKIWQEKRLEQSGIVLDWQARDYPSALAYWRDDNGPWRDVFIAFWKRVRERLGSEDPTAYNYWGNPRISNLFNKPTLFILTVDFFAFLDGLRAKINTLDEVTILVDQWLEEVAPTYFSRDWKLSGIKKDSVGTRRQWSSLWYKHRRQGGPAPAPAEFSKTFKSS